MKVTDAIGSANSLLPGTPAPEGKDDPRWQAIIDVAEFIQTNPEEVWSFIARWGIHSDEDLRMAIATCLLEHLLEFDFHTFFPRVEFLGKKNHNFAQTFMFCSKFGESAELKNSRRFDQLKKSLASAGNLTRRSS